MRVQTWPLLFIVTFFCWQPVLAAVTSAQNGDIKAFRVSFFFFFLINLVFRSVIFFPFLSLLVVVTRSVCPLEGSQRKIVCANAGDRNRICGNGYF